MSEKKRTKKACSIDFGIILVFGILILLFSSSAASAADTGWVAPTNNTAGSGTVTNPQNAYLNDNFYATFASSGTPSRNYFGYDFSSIPGGATIDSIEVNARGYRSGSGSNRYMQVRLSWNNGTQWTSYSPSTTEWTSTNNDHILVGSASDWGHSWTRNEILNNFRIEAHWMGSATGYLDYLPVRVYYTSGAGTTYSVSGYVTNASNSAAISGATVSADSTPPQSNTTNGTGYYNLSLANGNYIITASKTGYNSNSIPITVAGAPVGNANIALTPVPPSGGGEGKLLISTNRYVVLDDPNTGSFAGTGFKNPDRNWGTNVFNGVETTITVWGLLIGNNGLPLANTNVNFILKNPSGATDYTVSQTTDSHGIVNIARDLNAKNYYGKWDVLADSSGVTASTSFIYNWWGCAGGGGCGGHGSESLTSGAAINSPYMTGHDAVVGRDGAHQSSNVCMYCHLSYNGQGSTPGMNTADRHSSFTCTNTNCHGSISSHNSNMVIGSCDNCHTRGNITKKSTLNGILSTYSTTSTYHDQNSSIPCVICHGPMHNITKPDPTVGGLNDITEDAHCITCHTTYQKHNGGVGCTLCHSQDAHAIKVFSQAAGYVNKGNANKGDCTNCHQNATFLNALKNAPKAGSYSGTAPQVQKPLNHSTDSAGTKWDTYWTSTKDACIYCHGDNKHIATRLGNASVPVGSDQIGGAIGVGTVCSSCHNPADSNYLATMALLSPEPVGIISAGLNWNASGTDHASYGTTDSACQSCHGGVLSASPDISEFAHNVDVGKAGGPDCLSCHNSTGSANHRVDGNAITTGMHADLNAKDPADPNSKCWGCHDTDGNISNNPSNQLMGDRYNSPYKCVDCHLSTGEKSSGYGARIISEHYPSGNNISLLPGDNLAACIQCHNKSQMKVSYENPDNLFTNYSIVSHYGKNRTDMHNSNETNCSYCHQNPSEFNDIFVNPLNIQITHNNGNSCYLCHRESGQTDGRIHDSPLVGGAGGACLQCHSTGGGAPVVDETDLGDHKNLSGIGGTGVLTNEDCSTCHYNNPHTGTNPTNTYYCIDCHNKTQQLGNSSIRSTKKFDDKKHGEITCINCHIADGIYHQGNPRGSIANSTYINRNISNNPFTECGDCHYASNLDEAPFYAPGGGTHVRDCGNNGGCHSGNTIVAAVHSTTPLDSNNKKPKISDPILNYSTVTQGTDAKINVTVGFDNSPPNSQALVDGAQYQINNSDNTQIIQPWTPMIASDGNFNSLSEGAFARINTTNLEGTYNIFARGMGGGPAQNTLERYYPMNGDVSPVKSVTLTVQPEGGFITGTITSGGSALVGALVTTTGASNITGPDGTYTLSVPPGTYTVTASMEPTHIQNSIPDINVAAKETKSDQNMVLNLRPTGDISGNVTTV